MLSFSRLIAITPLLAFLLVELPRPALGQTSFNVPFTYQIGGAQPVPVLYDVFSATPISVSLATDGASWVTPSLSSNITPAVLTIGINTAGLDPGHYTSTIQVVSSQGPLTFYVTLDVTAAAGGDLTLSPSSFTFTAVAGGSAPASQTLTVTASASVSATAAVSEQSCAGSAWLMLSPSGSFTASPSSTVFTVSADSSGIAVGTTCSGTITISTGSATKTAAVTLNVTGAAEDLSLSASSFTFTAVAGGSASASQTLTVTAPASVGATAASSKQTCAGSSWLILSPSGSFTASPSNTVFTISVNPAGIAAGTTCSGTIAIGTASVTKTATVTLSVTGPPPTSFSVSPSAYTFSVAAGAAAPAPQTLTVTAGTLRDATAQVSQQICLNTNWLTLSPTGSFTAGPSGTVFTFSVNQAGVLAGTACKGAIVIVTDSATYTVPVVMNVIEAPTVILTLSPPVLSFSAVAGGLPPDSKTLKVSATFETSTTIEASEQSCGKLTWLTVSPTGSVTLGPANKDITVSVAHGGVAAGTTCDGTISITAGAAVRTVQVTLHVAEATPELTFNLSAVTFDAVAGGEVPDPQTLTVTARAQISAIAATKVKSCGSDWLTLSPTGSFTAGPATNYFTISVNQSVFGVGTVCTGEIDMVSASGTQTVPVSMVVTDPAASPIVSAAPTALSFTHEVGDPSPAPGVIAVTSSAPAATFSVSASHPEWLRVSPACTLEAPCTTPNTGTFILTVTADPSALDAGQTYYGTIVISGLGASKGTSNVNVSFTVTAPVPAITLVTNTASFVTGPVSPGEMVSIFADPAAPIGPATAVVLNDATCPAPCANLPTAMGRVQVMFQPLGVAAPLIYVSDTQINCLVPYEIVGRSSVKVEVTYLGQKSASVTLQTAATQPGVFTVSGTGTDLVSARQYDEQGNYQGQNLSANPAEPGWYITFYVTGEGIIPSPAVTGRVTTDSSVVPLLGPPKLLIDDQPAVVTHFAEAQGFVSGLMQVNAMIPAGVRTGQAVPLSLSMNGSHSQSGVVIYIQ